MPLLGGLLVTLITQFFAFFSIRFTANVAARLTQITVVVTLMIAFFGAMTALIAALSLISPPYLIAATSWFVPPHATATLSTVLAAHTTAFAYRFKKNLTMQMGHESML